jgi:spore maturation protein CgeB
MKIVIFCHSLKSDWNHGNAHFLRGVVTELIRDGHEVEVYEPEGAWSYENMLQEPTGRAALEGYGATYPALSSREYRPAELDLEEALETVDLVIVHEWSDHDLVAAIGEHRRRKGRYKLLFHDTHHRSVTERESMAKYDLSGYDGVLAFGAVIRDLYLKEGWAARAWTWHEAADTNVFHPGARGVAHHGEKGASPELPAGDLVWIGNWGDEERTAELHEFLINPVKELGLVATVYGVRYPDHAKKALSEAGISYGGWLPNYRAPEVFARHRFTVHVPRRPYVEALPGIPTIRPFEALACGIPLISAPWNDCENLFREGDFLRARDGEEMKRHMRRILEEPVFAEELAARGLETIRDRHTCRHRVDELMKIYHELQKEEEVMAV